MLAKVIVGLTFFSCGLALYLAELEVYRAFRERDPWPLAYASARIGFSIMVMLIAELVYHAGDIPLTWRAGLYLAGSAMVAVGYFFVALDQRRRNRRGTDNSKEE